MSAFVSDAIVSKMEEIAEDTRGAVTGSQRNIDLSNQITYNLNKSTNTESSCKYMRIIVFIYFVKHLNYMLCFFNTTNFCK